MMSTCKACGAEMNDDAKICEACGTAVDADNNEVSGAQAASQDVSDAVNSAVDSASAKIKDFNNTADTTSEYDPEDIKNNKAMAILAYFGILVFIPLFTAKESKYARFHTNQGLVLFVAEVISQIINQIIKGIPVVSLIGAALSIFVFVLFIIGLVNACKDRAKELPIIGGIRFLK